MSRTNKRAEEEREKLAAQLRQAQKMESVGHLAGGVAHDFNNILQVILGYTDMAIEQLPADHAARADMDQVKEAGEKAAQLVGQLLSFSRQQTLSPVTLNMNKKVDDLKKMLQKLEVNQI